MPKYKGLYDVKPGSRRFQHSRRSGRCQKSISAGLFALADPEHLGAAGRADTLSRGPAIFHGYFLRIFHFSFGLAFHTISFHLIASLNFYLLNYLHANRRERMHETTIFAITDKYEKFEDGLFFVILNFIRKQSISQLLKGCIFEMGAFQLEVSLRRSQYRMRFNKWNPIVISNSYDSVYARV